MDWQPGVDPRERAAVERQIMARWQQGQQMPGGEGQQTGFGAAQPQRQRGDNAFSPGRAQPMQMPSYGTPYGQQGGGQGFGAYSPQGGQQNNMAVSQQYSPMGNLAYAQPGQRPPPFQAAYGQIGGGFSSQPNFAQRDAFISNINNQLGQMQQQSWANPGSAGAPQFNFGRMWGQAGEMVERGWQSPLAGLFGDVAAFSSPEAAAAQGVQGPLRRVGNQFIAANAQAPEGFYL